MCASSCVGDAPNDSLPRSISRPMIARAGLRGTRSRRPAIATTCRPPISPPPSSSRPRRRRRPSAASPSRRRRWARRSSSPTSAPRSETVLRAAAGRRRRGDRLARRRPATRPRLARAIREALALRALRARRADDARAPPCAGAFLRRADARRDARRLSRAPGAGAIEQMIDFEMRLLYPWLAASQHEALQPA